MHQLDQPSPQRPPTERRVLIVDGHPLVRRGLAALIDAEPDLTVCARAATPREALEALASVRPDLVITDLSFGDGAGSEGLALVADIGSRHGDLPVLVLSMHEGSVWERRAVYAGASGYVSKREMGETLLVAIRAVLDGKYASQKVRAGLDPT